MALRWGVQAGLSGPSCIHNPTVQHYITQAVLEEASIPFSLEPQLHLFYWHTQYLDFETLMVDDLMKLYLTGTNQSIQRKICPIVNFFTTKPTWTAQETTVNLCGFKWSHLVAAFIDDFDTSVSQCPRILASKSAVTFLVEFPPHKVFAVKFFLFNSLSFILMNYNINWHCNKNSLCYTVLYIQKRGTVYIFCTHLCTGQCEFRCHMIYLSKHAAIKQPEASHIVPDNVANYVSSNGK